MPIRKVAVSRRAVAEARQASRERAGVTVVVSDQAHQRAAEQSSKIRLRTRKTA